MQWIGLQIHDIVRVYEQLPNLDRLAEFVEHIQLIDGLDIHNLKVDETVRHGLPHVVLPELKEELHLFRAKFPEFHLEALASIGQFYLSPSNIL